MWLYPDAAPPQLIPGRFDGVLAEGVITDASIVPGVPLTSLADLVEVIRAGGAYNDSPMTTLQRVAFAGTKRSEIGSKGAAGRA